MTITDTYERLDPHEVEAVRAYRRQLWSDLAVVDPALAKQQIANAIRTHSDPWVDGVAITTILSVAMRGKTVGDLTTTQRYALMSILQEDDA